jgi:SNF2 family DNA or RNA helicase
MPNRYHNCNLGIPGVGLEALPQNLIDAAMIRQSKGGKQSRDAADKYKSTHFGNLGQRLKLSLNNNQEQSKENLNNCLDSSNNNHKTAENLNATEDFDGRIPGRLLNTLAPFQEEGVKFIVENEGKVMLCDEMGLGKTIQAIAATTYYREDWLDKI